MRYFWRETDLTEAEKHLLQLTLEAHAESAFRPNISSMTVGHASEGSRDYGKAITAAIATIGGKHAPIAETFDLLMQPLDVTEKRITSGEIIPGWGNSFHKEHSDPIWDKVEKQIQLCRPDIYEKISSITDMLRCAGKKLFPNPSAFTAAVAIALGIPKELSPWIFIQGRIMSWAVIFNHHLKGVS